MSATAEANPRAVLGADERRAERVMATTSPASTAPPPSARSDRSPDDSNVGQSVDLYWLPLGAGGHSVRLNGKVFEAVQAARERRAGKALYHAALEVRCSSGRFVIEMTPIPAAAGDDRGVVSEGAVGSRWLGRFRLFRYEVRRWKDGVIPDVAEAIPGPVRLSDDGAAVSRLLELVPSVPTSVWGRDELCAGEMWTSNSVISWLIVRSGLAVESVRLPAGGRAPGWDAGVVAARREQRADVDRVLAAVRSCASRSLSSGRPRGRVTRPRTKQRRQQ
jgi:hypothetical protein